jgi:hypothetical protein
MYYILPIYVVHKMVCPNINQGEKCDRTSQVKNMPARTYNARTVPNPFRTHIARAEVQ